MKKGELFRKKRSSKHNMKITASFDSPDSADFAAGALKRALSPLTQIETKNLNTRHSHNNMNIFAAFNTASTTPTYSMPVYNPVFYPAFNKSDDEQEHYRSDTECVLEVTCRKEDESAASKIIISHGGRNISKLS